MILFGKSFRIRNHTYSLERGATGPTSSTSKKNFYFSEKHILNTSLLFGPWSLVPGLRSLVPGLRSLVSGLWSLVPGLWSLVSGPCSLVSGLWSLVSGPWSLVSSPWSLVPGLWSLVSGLWSLVPCLCSLVFGTPSPLTENTFKFTKKSCLIRSCYLVPHPWSLVPRLWSLVVGPCSLVPSLLVSRPSPLTPRICISDSHSLFKHNRCTICSYHPRLSRSSGAPIAHWP